MLYNFQFLGSKFHQVAACAILALAVVACNADNSVGIAGQSTTTSAASQPFVISAVPRTSVQAGTMYRYSPALVSTSEGGKLLAYAGGRVLSYAIVNKPEWATFLDSSGELSGTPDVSDVGTTGDIQINVSDGTANATVGPFRISVVAQPTDSRAPPPTPPTIAGTPGANVVAGQSYSFAPTVTNRGRQSLSFSIVNCPPWATFNTTTGALSGRPTSANVGNFFNILISVSGDGTPISLPAFSIQVQSAAESGPTISGIPATTVATGGNYSFTPVVINPDGNALTFSIANAPPWASFSSNTGQLSGTPASVDVGTYPNILISVSDGSASVSLPAFAIQVTPVGTGTKAEILLKYMKGLAGNGLLSGQYADYLVPGMMDQVPQIFAQTGKNPAILGTFMALEKASALVDVVTLSNQWLAQGGIVITMVSPGNPTWAAAGNDPILAADGTGGPTQGPGQPHGHAVNFGNLLIPGTPEYVVWQAFLAQLVTKFNAINGPVIVRPFPELNRSVQWWARQPPAQFIQVWQQMVTYVRNAGITNVLWCLNFSGSSLPPGYADLGAVVRAYYVGDAYVDIVSLDRYPPQAEDAPAIAALVATGKPVIYAEMGAVKGNPLPAPFSGDTSVALQAIISLYPQVVATVVWGASEALPEQNGMAAFMSNPKIINLADLPPSL